MEKNIVCWFEIYVADIDRAKKFYSAVLGAAFDDADMPGEENSDAKMAFFKSDSEYAVSGALVQMPYPESSKDKGLSTMVYFPCEDCATEESRVEDAGGTISTHKMSIGEHGFCSLCVDTEGNHFGLHSLK